MNRYVLYALAFLAALLAVRAFKEAGAAELRAELAEAKADSLYLDAQDAQRALLEELKTREVEYVRLVGQRDSAVSRADRAAAARPRIVERIVQVAGDSAAVVEALNTLDSLHAQEIAAYRDALSVSDSIVRATDAKLTATLFANRALQDALEAARSESRAWETAKRPSLLGIPMTPTQAFGLGILVTASGVVYMVLR